jgi:hypothetical protein
MGYDLTCSCSRYVFYGHEQLFHVRLSKWMMIYIHRSDRNPMPKRWYKSIGLSW